jgi:hypothetical protein
MTKQTSTEYGNFKALLARIVTVPHEEILRREEEYKKQMATNPRKRGPKRKTTQRSGDAETSPVVGLENL